jgi:two-component system NarL family response regulator
MQPDMTVVAEASNGHQAVEMFRKHQPDVTLLDMRMPGMGGVEAATAIRAEFPHARMIALTTYGGDEDIRRALAAGVQAYLTKDVLHDELLKAIRAVHAGQTYLPAAVAASLAAQLPRPDLSAREVQVLELIVQGLANKQIAYTLNIAEHTVKNHVKNILSKLGCRTARRRRPRPSSAASSTCKPGGQSRYEARPHPRLRPSRGCPWTKA